MQEFGRFGAATIRVEAMPETRAITIEEGLLFAPFCMITLEPNSVAVAASANYYHKLLGKISLQTEASKRLRVAKLHRSFPAP